MLLFLWEVEGLVGVLEILALWLDEGGGFLFLF